MITLAYAKHAQGMTLSPWFRLNPIAVAIRGALAAQWQAHVDAVNRAYDDEAADAMGWV
ncbi:hypothetical protein D3C80_429650 [compost metagenome]